MSHLVTPNEENSASRTRRCVHVYCSSALEPGLAELDLLSSDDFERAGEFSRPSRRTEYLAGRALLRFALELATGAPGKSHRISTSPDGKPFCVDGPQFSVSHSGNIVVCAVAETDTGSVGVDVQLPRRGYRVEEIARSCFSPEESDWLAGRSDCFYMLWVLKEAYLKASGRGLAGGLDALRCRISPPTIDARVAVDACAPKLALYSLDTAFLGLAGIDCPLSDVSIARVSADGDVSLISDARSIATLGFSEARSVGAHS